VAALLTPDELQRRAALRRMKAIAGGLLLIAVVLFLLSRNHDGFLGFVNSGAEAAMVGGLADWFAVTALFRHPLGLPIPHTALIPNRKDMIGHSLESFVASNFLSEDVVKDKVARAQIAARVGAWLEQPDHAARVGQEIATAVRAAMRVLRDEDVVAIIEGALLRKVTSIQWGPPLGRLLGKVVDEGAHHRLVDIGIDAAHTWLLANEATVVDIVSEHAPSWSPKFLDDAVAGRAYREVLKFVRDMQSDPRHPSRVALDNLLLKFADDLATDPYTIHRVELLKERLVDRPDVRDGVGRIWTTGRTMLLDAVDDESGELRRRIAGGIADLGHRLATEPELQARVDRYVSDAAAHAAGSYSGEVATIISETVGRWDGQEASRRIELMVGRDLQFIRINGTVVGTIVGLLIHTVSVLL
jgi:uncharacterized membrane-anchored protein YjiN (DUF445 family)